VKRDDVFYDAILMGISRTEWEAPPSS
jgi:hypothetical protein